MGPFEYNTAVLDTKDSEFSNPITRILTLRIH